MTIKGRHSFTLLENKSFSIEIYKTEDFINLPNGKTTKTITVKGQALPKEKGLLYEITGELETYTKADGSENYTLKAESVLEVIPTEEEGIKAYLATINGVGKTLADRIYEKFNTRVFSVIENHPEELTSVKGISKAKAEKIQRGLALRQAARQLFEYLYRFGIKEKQIMRIHTELGEDALERVKENPYCILEIANIGFKTADAIARKARIPKDDPERIRAAIVEVLMEAERGGEAFNKFVPFPEFMYNCYLRKELFDMLSDESIFTTGGTYLGMDVLYLMTLKLLDTPVSESEFSEYLCGLHKERKIFVSKESGESFQDARIYKRATAICEYGAAKQAAYLMDTTLPVPEDLIVTIRNKEKQLGILLSSEQRDAVAKALTSPISVITGGPGTGKTSIEKVILEVFKYYYPKESFLLAAPTGRAAKRMSEQTGEPAATLHKVLGIYADDNGDLVEVDEQQRFSEKLMIVDETSMVGTYLFNTLLGHIMRGTRLVLIGDIDQLPSIEVGAVLRELIDCDDIPTTRLTKTFRQAAGSTIAVNASRIKVGEKRLDFASDFCFIEEENSEKIADKIAEMLPSLIKKYGDDEVMVLTAFRKKTESGANALNEKLRNVLRHDIDEKTKFFERNGIRIYEGDKIMNTRNTELLANGDLGTVKKVVKSKSGLIVTCTFNGVTVVLEDDETDALELAYAMTVHKSQGSEAACVVLVTDMAHKILNKRNLFYTGVTRSKKMCYVIGQSDAMNLSIDTQDSVYRKSKLAYQITKYAKKGANSTEKMVNTVNAAIPSKPEATAYAQISMF